MRFKPEAHAKIVAICERYGVSYNQAVNIAVDGLTDATMEAIHGHAYELGFQEGVRGARPPARAAGFAEAASLYRIAVPCRNCGQPIELRLDDSTASVAIRALIDSGFQHTPCPSRPTYTAL